MYYTIYKTTNIINGKFYIGKHQTKNLNDGYIGSGKLLKRAIKKYGIENFHTEILHICKDEKHMNLLEKILVVPDSETNYNLCEGGHGGFGYINENLLQVCEKQKKAAAQWCSASKPFQGKKHSQQTLKKISVKVSEKFMGEGNPFYGKTHSPEWKQNHSHTMKNKQRGQLNSQYGTCWITNGIENKKIKKEELDSWIELGYNRGKIQAPIV